jgi:two-component system, chemotaxis family, chemotaxis protein CheY
MNEGLNKRGLPYKVLIIDDSTFIAKQLSKILTSEGFEVADTATNGAMGVKKYIALHPNIDLVTMDITMPGTDGVSALEKILEFDKEAKVIMISAVGSDDVVKKCVLMGAKGYITKPLDRDKVLQRIIPVLK